MSLGVAREMSIVDDATIRHDSSGDVQDVFIELPRNGLFFTRDQMVGRKEVQ
jgi:hypothetical protein